MLVNFHFFSNVVNLLTNVPPTCLDQLLIKSHWCDVDALKVIINFLDNRLSNTEVMYTPLLLFTCIIYYFSRFAESIT